MTSATTTSAAAPPTTNPTVPAVGLRDVVVAETELGDVRGEEGFYHYRQYSAIEVASRRSFEDAWHLLFYGDLPGPARRAAFAEEVSALRSLPGPVAAALPLVARASAGGGSLAGLRSAVSLLAAAERFGPSMDADAGTLRRQALRVSAVVPTIVAGLYRVSHGLEPLDPRPDLGHAANYLYLLRGVEPSPEEARAVEQYLTLTIDHGFNASTFAARVVASTGADLGSAVVAAIGALSGPLHGGAPSRALDTLDAIGSPERAEEWVRAAIASGEKIMGFGHAVYRTEDPRSRLLRQVAEGLGGPLVDFAEQVEATVLRLLAELKPGRGLYTNVEFYAGVVMDRCGLPRELFTPTFACSRTVGWCAQILEQASHNRLIRPSARYVGPTPPEPLPLSG
jgi:citrate synthase